MTATIFAFPDAYDRDQLEFERNGCSNLTRAIGEGKDLWVAVRAEPGSAGLAARIDTFGRRVAHLASYRDDLPMVQLPSVRVELIALPALLNSCLLS